MSEGKFIVETRCATFRARYPASGEAELSKLGTLVGGGCISHRPNNPPSSLLLGSSFSPRLSFKSLQRRRVLRDCARAADAPARKVLSLIRFKKDLSLSLSLSLSVCVGLAKEQPTDRAAAFSALPRPRESISVLQTKWRLDIGVNSRSSKERNLGVHTVVIPSRLRDRNFSFRESKRTEITRNLLRAYAFANKRKKRKQEKRKRKGKKQESAFV